MKNTVWMMLVLMLAAAPAQAANDFSGKDSKKETKEVSKKESKAKPQATDAKREEARKKLKELKEKLNGSQWEVDLSSEGKSIGKDTFTFQNGQVTNKMLTDKGYPATNYTVSQPEGADMATWETMQTSAKGQVAFVRGEWKDDTMRGVISEQLEEGKSKDYSFLSVGKTVVPATTEEKVEPKSEAPAVAEPAGQEAAVSAVEEAPAVAAFAPGTTDEMGEKQV